MGKKVRKYPEIGQYRNAIQAVTNVSRYVGKDENGDPIYNTDTLPTIRYKLTPKAHGSNGSVQWIYNNEINMYDFHIQSRERIITPMSDNMGFATYIYRISDEALYKELVLPLLMELSLDSSTNKYHTKVNEDGELIAISHPDVQIYGEWSGKGIQKKVGISNLEKFFMVFGVKVNGIWVSDKYLHNIKLPEHRIFNVLDYKSYEIDIDFNNPKEYTDQFDKWVTEIEDECPIAAGLGFKNGIGEGWVAKPIDPKWHHGRYFFKIKGVKHKGDGRDKKNKIQIDPIKVANLQKLVDLIVDSGRLEQGLSKLKENGDPINIKSMGKYLKWLSDDTIKEELDTIIENGFEPKEITKHISNKGRKWFMNYLDKELGL